jgi:hypothetical protein
MVVPTIHGLTVDGIDNTGKNRAVESFAASRPGTQAPDWAGAVAAHPELMQADDLHPIAAGAELRAQLIARGIEDCLAYAAAAKRGPLLESGPDLPLAGRLARREATLEAAIAAELARRLATRIAAGVPALAAALAVASTELGDA